TRLASMRQAPPSHLADHRSIGGSPERPGRSRARCSFHRAEQLQKKPSEARLYRRGSVPITFSIDTQGSLIRTIGSGNVTPAEVDAHFTELSNVWPRGAKLDVLLDLSGCTSLPEIPQLRAVVSRIQMFGGRKRFGVCAIVASRELLYGLLRVFELLAD